MKVLVTGANGFIGNYWVDALLRSGCTVVATGATATPRQDREGVIYHALDITDEHAVRTVVALERPEAVLHAAAMSKPDACELNPEKANRVNVQGTKYLLEAAASCQSYFCFISTDFVFDGTKGMYAEADPVSPVNHYGLTKCQAEQLVQQYAWGWSIARTITVYGASVPGKQNILGVVVDKLNRGDSYTVVDDQIRTPTYAGDLAAGVAALIVGRHHGIFHLSGAEVMTPFQMAIRLANYLGLDASGLIRVTADTFQQPAKRPPKTGFVIEKARRIISYDPIPFEEGLRLCFPRD